MIVVLIPAPRAVGVDLQHKAALGAKKPEMVSRSFPQVQLAIGLSVDEDGLDLLFISFHELESFMSLEERLQEVCGRLC